MNINNNVYMENKISSFDLTKAQKKFLLTVAYKHYNRTDELIDKSMIISTKDYSNLWKVSEKTSFSIFTGGKDLDFSKKVSCKFGDSVVTKIFAKNITFFHNMPSEERYLQMNLEMVSWGYVNYIVTIFKKEEIVLFRFLKSIHSYSLLEMFFEMRYNKVKMKTILLNDLYIFLGIDGKYKMYSKFKQNVLTPAMEEIKRIFKINVSCLETKAGTKVIGFVFVITEFTL